MLSNFSFCVKTNFIFGKNAQDTIAAELKRLNVKKVLIHHDSGGYLYDTGLLERLTQSLKAESIEFAELGGVLPNPRLSLVYEGVRLAKAEKVDFVLAIGGGSSIDSAKAIAAGAVTDTDVWDFFSKGVEIENALPVGVLLTYPATGSESSAVTVINNTETQEKKLASSPLVRPCVAFMNPELTYTLPPILTAYGIADMFSHTCERYFSPGQPIGVIDRMAHGILKTLAEIGSDIEGCANSYDARSELMWIGTIAHNNTVGVGRGQDWATHEIGNELSSVYDLPHGATLTIIMPSWMRYVYKHDVRRFAEYARCVFGITEASDEAAAVLGIEATESFFKWMKLPVSLREAGVPAEEFDLLLDKMSFTGDQKTLGGFFPLTRSDVLNILRMAR